MKLKIFTIVALLLFASGSALSATYMITDDWGGTWADVNKNWDNDWNLCWAGAASNILEYTGWGMVDGMTTTDDMFAEYEDHFSDLGSLPDIAWDWWWDGTNIAQGWPNWAQEDVDGGGGFYPTLNVNDYMRSSSSDLLALSNINNWMHDGYGCTLAIRGGVDHAITPKQLDNYIEDYEYTCSRIYYPPPQMNWFFR